MKKNKKVLIMYFIFIVAFISMLFSLYKILNWTQDNKTVKKTNDKIIDEVITEKKDEKFEVDFNKLKEMNTDVVGWIKVNNTNINYPIVKTNDNDFYINHDFNKNYNESGWVFANYLNKFDKEDRNITLFAHNRLDGSMFGTLRKVLTKEWQENKDNYDILFITEDEESIYRVFSTYKIEKEDYYIKTDFYSSEDFLNFINTLAGRSYYDYNVPITENDKILTLSTCDFNNNYRVVLHAKKIEKEGE